MCKTPAPQGLWNSIHSVFHRGARHKIRGKNSPSPVDATERRYENIHHRVTNEKGAVSLSRNSQKKYEARLLRRVGLRRIIEV